MYNTNSLFEERKKELEFYYSILLDIDSGKPNIRTIDNSAFFKILKSNFILMLYNLIESCVVSGIMEIYDELKRDECSYDEVIEEIKAIWRNRQIDDAYSSRQAKQSTYEKKVEQIISAISSKTPIILTRVELKSISGNLDANRIKKICDKHRIRYVVEGDTDNLLTVKQKRNSLAHGDVSFSDCARDLTMVELEKMKDDVLVFMQNILDGMKKYYDSHGYKIG